MQNFGKLHPNVAISQSNLALVYQDLGDYEKARDLLEGALKSALQNFGELHPNVAISQSNLAVVYQDLGDYEKARDLLEGALKKRFCKTLENSILMWPEGSPTWLWSIRI
ncbi:MAG: tetratricopeptide repeat protein [Saprospiraceae bacterium]|nr:tetratricopeptide repeat protein [Saprospiraceae bacterium]